MRRVRAAVLATVVLLAGCSGDGGDDGDRGATTTTAARGTAPYAADGPYAVGTQELTAPDGRRVVVWYPADRAAVGGAPPVEFDIEGELSPDLQARIPPNARTPYVIDAHRDIEPADGRFPIVLFSHGYAGFPEQSSTLTTHLTEWGFVVVAPEHVERSLGGLLGGRAEGIAPSNDPDVLAAALDLAATELDGLVDPGRVTVVGHSAGAAAAYDLARGDERIDGFVAWSVADLVDVPVPDAPGAVMLGDGDGVIPPVQSRALFERMRRPKWLVEIPNAGHLVFSDICLIGAEQGGVAAIAQELDLGIPDDLLRLARDGCETDALAPTDAFPAIGHLTVAVLRRAVGIDDRPVGMSTEAVAGLGPAVTVRSVG